MAREEEEEAREVREVREPGPRCLGLGRWDEAEKTCQSLRRFVMAGRQYRGVRALSSQHARQGEAEQSSAEVVIRACVRVCVSSVSRRCVQIKRSKGVVLCPKSSDQDNPMRRRK